MKRAPHKRIFPNRYNGVGGHIERYEDPLTSARREIKEETGFEISDLSLRAIYNIDAGTQTGIILFVYVGQAPSREVILEGSEGTLHWIPIDEVQDYDLVEDLPVLLPYVLAKDKETIAYIHVSYDENDKMIMKFAESTNK